MILILLCHSGEKASFLQVDSSMLTDKKEVVKTFYGEVDQNRA